MEWNSRSKGASRTASERRPASLWLTFVFIMALAFSPAGQALASGVRHVSDSDGELLLFAGESRLLETTSVERLAVGLPEVAAVQVVSPRQVLLNGVSPGATNLLVWDEGKVRSYRVNVLPRENELLAHYAWRFLGDPSVRFRSLGSRLYLDGTVENEQQRIFAESVARAFASDVTNNLKVRQETAASPVVTSSREDERLADVAPDIGTLRKLLTRDYPGVTVEEIQESLLIRGEVAESEDVEAIGKIAGLFADKIVNIARVRKPKEKDIPLAEPTPADAVGGKVKEAEPVGTTPAMVAGETSLLANSAGSHMLSGWIRSDYPPDYEDALREQLSLRLMRLVTPVAWDWTVLEQIGDTIQVDRPEVTSAEKSADVDRVAGTQAVTPAPASRMGELESEGRISEFSDHIKLYSELKRVSVRAIHSRFVLEGEVASDDAVLLAARIAELYFPPEQVVNLLKIVPPAIVPAANLEQQAEEMEGYDMDAVVAQVHQALDNPAIEVRRIDKYVVLEGKVPNERVKQRAAMLAEILHPHVLNLLEIMDQSATKDFRPIQVKVRVLEVEVDALKQLGIDWKDKVEFGVELGFPIILGKGIQIDLQRFLDKLDLLERDGRTRLLAEPNLVTLPGQPASFLSGGQIPVPVEQPGRTVVEWKDYGVKLTVTPNRNEDGSLTVSVMPEVSSLDWGAGSPVSGGRLPALRTTRAETLVTIPDGGTLVLGGLVHEERSKQAEGLPYLHDVPVVGQLFGTNSLKERRNEVVIVLTASSLSSAEGGTSPHGNTDDLGNRYR